MRARIQKETSHIIDNYYEIAGKGCKYTKKIARKYVLCISIARYIVCTDTWYCKKKLK